jgi:hypothetical protein
MWPLLGASFLQRFYAQGKGSPLAMPMLAPQASIQVESVPIDPISIGPPNPLHHGEHLPCAIPF